MPRCARKVPRSCIRGGDTSTRVRDAIRTLRAAFEFPDQEVSDVAFGKLALPWGMSFERAMSTLKAFLATLIGTNTGASLSGGFMPPRWLIVLLVGLASLAAALNISPPPKEDMTSTECSRWLWDNKIGSDKKMALKTECDSGNTDSCKLRAVATKCSAIIMAERRARWGGDAVDATVQADNLLQDALRYADTLEGTAPKLKPHFQVLWENISEFPGSVVLGALGMVASFVWAKLFSRGKVETASRSVPTATASTSGKTLDGAGAGAGAGVGAGAEGRGRAQTRILTPEAVAGAGADVSTCRQRHSNSMSVKRASRYVDDAVEEDYDSGVEARSKKLRTMSDDEDEEEENDGDRAFIASDDVIAAIREEAARAVEAIKEHVDRVVAARVSAAEGGATLVERVYADDSSAGAAIGGSLSSAEKRGIGTPTHWAAPVISSNSCEILFKDLAFDRDEDDMQIELGHGTFGTVYAGRWMGERVAIKKMTLPLAQITSGRFWREVQLHMQASYKHVVRVYGAAVKPVKGKVVVMGCYVVMDRLVTDLNGALHESFPTDEPAHKVAAAVRALPERLRLLLEIARGVRFLHAKGIVHADLKPGNVMLDKYGAAQLTDFGLAVQRTLDASRIRSSHKGERGTPVYMDPALVGGEGASVKPSSDMYSWGVLAWEVLTGRKPYEGVSSGGGAGAGASGAGAGAVSPLGAGAGATMPSFSFLTFGGERPDVILDGVPDVPPPLCDLIQRCWNEEQGARPSAETVIAVLEAIVEA